MLTSTNTQTNVEIQLQHLVGIQRLAIVRRRPNAAGKKDWGRGRQEKVQGKIVILLSRLQHMGYFIVVRHVECVFNANYLAKASCDVISPRNRSVNAELQLIQKIRHIMGTLKVSIPNAKKKMQKIFDVTFELCKVLKERKRKSLIELLNAMSGMPGDTRVFCPFNEVSFDIYILDLSILII